jgi:hypothetical protein
LNTYSSLATSKTPAPLVLLPSTPVAALETPTTPLPFSLVPNTPVPSPLLPSTPAAPGATSVSPSQNDENKLFLEIAPYLIVVFRIDFLVDETTGETEPTYYPQ